MASDKPSLVRSWFNAIRGQSNQAVDYAASALTGNTNLPSAPSMFQPLRREEVIDFDEVTLVYNNLEALSTDLAINDLKSLRLSLVPIWQMHQDGRLKSIALVRLKLNQSDWLYRTTIKLPFDNKEEFPFHLAAKLMFESPLRLTFLDVPKFFRGVAAFPSLFGIGYIPRSNLNWTIAEHEQAGKHWRAAVAEWNKWLVLITDQGFVPSNNVDFQTAFYQNGERMVPLYVNKWFLVRYGDFKISNIFSLIRSMATTPWDDIPLYAMSDLIFLDSQNWRVVSAAFEHPSSLTIIVKRFCEFGGNQHQLDRLLSFGDYTNLDSVSPTELNIINDFALNTRNVAVLNTLGPTYLPLVPEKISPKNKHQADLLVVRLIVIRRDMWDYLLENTSKDLRDYIGRALKQALQISKV
jgi:hypothetical protein